jgi:hypothetical protein
VRGGEGSNVDIWYLTAHNESRHMHNLYPVKYTGTVRYPLLARDIAISEGTYQYRMHTASIGTGTNGTEHRSFHWYRYPYCVM